MIKTLRRSSQSRLLQIFAILLFEAILPIRLYSRPAQAEANSSPVLVRFNKTTYTVADIDQIISKTPSFSLLQKQESADIDALRHFVASQMIDRQLLQTYAIESRGVVESEVEAGLERIIQGYGGKEELQKLLTPIGSSLEQFTSDMRTDLEIGSFVTHVITPKLTVSEDEIQAWYKEEGKTLSTPEKIKAQQIVIPIEQNAGADEVAEVKKRVDSVHSEIIKSPEKFATYAQKFNFRDRSEAKGEQSAIFSRGTMLPEVEAVAFKLKTGAISAPIRSQVGFHILKIEEKLPSTIPPLAEAHDKIVEIIKKNKSDKEIEQILIKLRSKADIVFEKQENLK